MSAQRFDPFIALFIYLLIDLPPPPFMQYEKQLSLEQVEDSLRVLPRSSSCTLLQQQLSFEQHTELVSYLSEIEIEYT